MAKYYQYNADQASEILDEAALTKYFQKDLGWGKRYQSKKVLNLLLTAARFCKGGVILDAGAGHQRYRPFYNQALYLSQEHQDGVVFKDMKALEYDLLNPIDEQIPLKNNCLDGILSTSVMEHLLHPDIFCKEAYRVLKPGGKIFINVPFAIIEHEKPYDFNRPTRYVLQKWLEDAGFSSIVIEPSSSCTETVCNVLPITVYGDILKTDEGYEKNFQRVSKLKKPFYIKWGGYLRIVYAGGMYVLTKISSAALKQLVDRGPYDKALLPAGWIVIATKSGKHIKNKKLYQREEFLKKYKI